MDQAKPSLVQPYLNADVYRAHDNTNARAPSLDSLKIRAGTHLDGKTLVGCSDLTGRFWNGAVRISDSPADINLENINHIDKSSQSLIELESGANDVCFVNNTNKMVTCEDRGCVSVWEYTEEPAWGGLWNLVCSATEHDDAVMAVAPFHDTEAVVTVGADSCVKIWGITEMLAVQTYRAAHGCMIEDVAIQPKSNKIFVTASIDRNISLWDRDLSKRVKILGSLESGARCICWVDDHRVLIGDEAGDLNVLDIRTSVLTHLKTFYSALHRIVYNERSGLIGICGDNKTLSVFRLSKSNKLEAVYEDKSHTDYVRSLAWDHINDSVVYSASWDGTIKTHRIDLSDNMVPESSS